MYRPRHFGKITYIDDYKFDSEEEAKYYTDVIKPKMASGEITHLAIHPSFTIIYGFDNVNGKRYNDRIYSPDFAYDEKDQDGDYIRHYIDVKDREDDEFKIKRMLFDQLMLLEDSYLEVLKYWASEKRFVSIEEYPRLMKEKRKAKIRSDLLKEQELEKQKEEKRIALLNKYEAELATIKAKPSTTSTNKRIEWLTMKISSLR